MWISRSAGWRPYEHNGHHYWDLMNNGLEHLILDGTTHVVLFKNNHKKTKYSKAVLNSDVAIDEIKPSSTINRLEKRQRVLKDAARIGALAAIEAFQPTETEIDWVREKYEPLGISI